MPLSIIRGDITAMRVDAIVNAANRTLLGGGGVDGAIHRAAGPGLLRECETLGGCDTGQAVITKGYDLPARHVIHTVGPVWQDGQHGEPALLASCYRTSLEVAAKSGCESVAFPLISAGAYGYPGDLALKVAVDAISAFLNTHEMQVYLVIFDKGGFWVSSSTFQGVSDYMNAVLAEQPASRAPRPGRILNEALDVAPEFAPPAPMAASRDSKRLRLQDILTGMDESFSQMLLRLIDERGMTDVACYKAANVDRKLFSKIRSNKDYQPSKTTALAFALALELSLPETHEFLRKAGFALSRSSKLDIIVEYCILNNVRNVHEVNRVLFQFDQSMLGSA